MQFLLKLVLVIAGVVFVFSLAIASQSYGLEQGLQIGELETDEILASHDIKTPQFAVDGTRTYVYLHHRYTLICFYLSMVIVGCLFAFDRKNKDLGGIVSTAFGAIGSLLSLYVLKGMIRDNSLVSPYFWDVPRNAFAKITIFYDWVFVALIILIFLFQLIVLYDMVMTRLWLRK
jgi:hypothetical protein